MRAHLLISPRSRFLGTKQKDHNLWERDWRRNRLQPAQDRKMEENNSASQFMQQKQGLALIA